MASNLFWISAAKVVEDLGAGPHTAATLLTEYGWTFTRADASTCATYWTNAGLLATAPAGSLRIQYEDLNASGLRATPTIWLEGARTNVALWNRDLTNAAWVKSNITPVKDQTGIDGVANSASKITATAANGTCLQTVTLASSSRLQSAFVKRITGSGTVNMTTDNGGTWTAVTVTSAWTRVTIPTQTVTDPVFGFRLVTSGDAIAVDYVQNENGAFISNPIATTTAAVTRASDALSLTFYFGPMDMTIWQRTARPTWADAAGSIGVTTPFWGRVGATVPRLDVRSASSSRLYVGTIDTATTDSSANVAIPAGILSSSFQFKNLTTAGQVAIDPGSGLGAFASAGTAFSAFGSQILFVGGSGAAANELCGGLMDLKGRAGLVSLALMATETFSPVSPFEVTDLDLPGPLISKAQSGRVNTRSIAQSGATWTERYLLNVNTASHREFLARARSNWRNGTIITKGHVDYAVAKGIATGTPLVKGASQSGSTLLIDGATANIAGWLLAGDIFRIAGLPQMLQAAADVNTDATGQAVIQLVTPIFTGGSPADNATLTVTGVTMDVVILEPPDWPTSSGRSSDWGELTLRFSEAL